MPRFKPLMRWEPFPFLVLVVLVVAISIARPDRYPVAFWVLLPLVAAALAFFAVMLLRDTRRADNPASDGGLRSLEGLELVESPPTADPPTPVADVHRHRSAIEVARINAGEETFAVLVPRASRWLSLRYRVGVQLIAGGRAHHAGFLGEAAERRWAAGLDRLRDTGHYVRVPARISGDRSAPKVDLDLAGLVPLTEGDPV